MILDQTTREHVQSAINEVPHRSGDLGQVVIRGRRRRRVRVSAWGLVTLAAAVLLLGPLFGVAPNDAASPGTVSGQAQILADGWVTEAEYLSAGSAVVSCVQEQGFEASWSPGDMSFTTHYPGWDDPFVKSPAALALNECLTIHIKAVLVAWSAQPYNPEGDVGLFRAAVECTSARAGRDFGEIEADADGNLTKASAETLQRVFDEASDVYPECMRDVATQD